MTRANYQRTADRFTALFNRITKARLSGAELAPALASALGHELAAINVATDLPPGAVPVWNAFVDQYLSLPAKPGEPLGDPLAKLRGATQYQAEEAMNMVGEVQALVLEGMKNAR